MSGKENKNNIVIIEVEGGVADIAYCPDHIKVVIIDYDNEGEDQIVWKFSDEEIDVAKQLMHNLQQERHHFFKPQHIFIEEQDIQNIETVEEGE